MVSSGWCRSTRVGARPRTKAPSSRFSSTLVSGYVLNARRALIRNDAKFRPSISRAIVAFIWSTVDVTR